MAVVSISICTRLGNPVICRNYIGISQSRLESLLSTFPRSLSPGQQHSFVETREARFVFQPLEQFFLVLITSKSSNLFQDLDTLHLANRIISNTCPSLDEASFLEHCFELSFAFDEIVSCGYSENITLPQITSNLAMESQEEVLQELVEKNKIQEAREISKQKMKQLELEKRDSRKFGLSGSGSAHVGSFSTSSMSDHVHVQTEIIDTTTSVSNKTSKTVRSGKGMSLKKY